MKTIVAFFKSLADRLTRAKEPAELFFNSLLRYIPAAFPMIEFVARLTTFSDLDDRMSAYVKNNFPGILRKDLTPEEKKLYLLAVASELLREKFPGMTTTAARICVQVAYGLKQVGGWLLPA